MPKKDGGAGSKLDKTKLNRDEIKFYDTNIQGTKLKNGKDHNGNDVKEKIRDYLNNINKYRADNNINNNDDDDEIHSIKEALNTYIGSIKSTFPNIPNIPLGKRPAITASIEGGPSSGRPSVLLSNEPIFPNKSSPSVTSELVYVAPNDTPRDAAPNDTPPGTPPGTPPVPPTGTTAAADDTLHRILMTYQEAQEVISHFINGITDNITNNIDDEFNVNKGITDIILDKTNENKDARASTITDFAGNIAELLSYNNKYIKSYS